MKKSINNHNNPAKLMTYFYREKTTLIIVAITGIVYNVGMIAGPWFEGRLTGYLCDVLRGNRDSSDIIILALWYVLIIGLVQVMRYFKRLYVRKFANNTSRSMKKIIYGNFVNKSGQQLAEEGAGTLMTKAIADVEACTEGMRKFTTEVFDTGVVMMAYLAMLLIYDWRLALISIVFPPIAYVLAELLKKLVTRTSAERKESAGRLNQATLDRAGNAITYKVYGQETRRQQLYEDYLTDYENKAVRADVLETSMQPLYQIIAMFSTIFILWFGGKNVLGTGWTAWDIAAFSTFLSCFLKLAVKSSKAAKLFNAVQKARVSWNRIKAYMLEIEGTKASQVLSPAPLVVSHMEFSYPGNQSVLEDVNFHINPGEIVGVTGAVASGKSTLGKVFLCENPYEGSITFGGQELKALMDRNSREQHQKQYSIIGYLGHNYELFSDTIRENICLGEEGDIDEVLRVVCMDEEVRSMPLGADTVIGQGGMRLSGGQQARIALARALFHMMPVIILDDPFSAVDKKTEEKIMTNMREMTADRIVILISHRIALFNNTDKVIWIENKKAEMSNHESLMKSNQIYREIYNLQTKGGEHNEA